MSVAGQSMGVPTTSQLDTSLLFQPSCPCFEKQFQFSVRCSLKLVSKIALRENVKSSTVSLISGIHSSNNWNGIWQYGDRFSRGIASKPKLIYLVVLMAFFRQRQQTFRLSTW